MEAFKIKNPLLNYAINGGTRCSEIPLESTGGYLYHEERPIGRAFLEYCYSVIFGIHRFPGYQNYYDLCNYECSWLVESGAISETDIREACLELKHLYDYTQKYLVETGTTELTLYRTLNRSEIDSAKHIVEKGKKTGKISYMTNIMSSYTRNPNLNYHGKVKIRRTVDIDMVLMLDFLTSYPIGLERCPYKPQTGEYEVWIKTENRFGEVIISEEDVVEGRDTFLKAANKPNVMLQTEMRYGDCSLSESCTDPGFPCELNIVSRYLVRKHMRKMQKIVARG